MTYCHVSAQIDQHAHEEGLKAEREIWLQGKRDDIEHRLNTGKCVQLFSCSYNKAEILHDKLGYADMVMLASVHNGTGATSTLLKILMESISEIMEKWIDENLETIIAAEVPDDYNSYEDAA